MSDTPLAVAALVAERHRRMTPQERIQIASAMFDTARVIVASSLPAGLSDHDRRLAIAKRIYGDELPRAALEAHAAWEARDAGFPPSRE